MKKRNIFVLLPKIKKKERKLLKMYRNECAVLDKVHIIIDYMHEKNKKYEFYKYYF